MSFTGNDPSYFTRVVTEMGERRPVVTTQALYSDRGVKILDQGVTVHAGLYERLMAHRLSRPIEQSLTSPKTVTGTVLRDQADEVLRAVPLLARLSRDAAVRESLLDAVGSVALPEPIAFQLTLALEMRPELFSHSVCAALVAVWLAMAPSASRVTLGQAAAAGLLHDLGLLHLDPVLLKPQGTIGREQQRHLYAHALVSAALLEPHPEYARDVVRAVREHHEFVNGSGYPAHLRGDAISRLGRVLGLAELISAMIARKRAATELRLWVMMRLNKSSYDAELLARALAQLVPQDEAQVQGLVLMPDAVARLLHVHEALTGWPDALIGNAKLSASRRDGVAEVNGRVLELRRALASVGVAPLQLQQLGHDAPDPALHRELTLLAQEATWQLRALARLLRRRWRLAPGEPLWPPLQAWLDQVEALVAAMDGTPV